MDKDVRKLLSLLALAGFEANPECQNPVCQQMAVLEAALEPKSRTNGKAKART